MAAGCGIPDDVSVMASDNVELSTIVNPPSPPSTSRNTKSVRQPSKSFSASPDSMGPSLEHRLFGVHLVERKVALEPCS